MGLFDIYKKNQGKYTRLCTLGGVMILIIIGCKWLSDRLDSFGTYVKFLVPIVLGLLCGYCVFWIVYRRESMSDFLIATEGEMKKVSWSSKKEIIGSTKVVVFTTIFMAVLLFVVDIIFQTFFQQIGVLQMMSK